MGSFTRRRARSAAVLVAAGLLVAACGGGGSSSSNDASAAPSASGSSADTGSNGSSADPGISKDSVTVGTVVTLTGPIPGLFQGAQYGTEAAAAMINSQGGVNGRQIKVETGDDGLNCNQNATETEKLIPKVFALVGGFSNNDGCSAEEIGKSGIPYFEAYALDPKAAALPNNYPAQPAPPGFRTGPFQWYKQKFPDAVTKAAALYGNTPGGVAQYNQQKEVMEGVGYKFVYERQHALTETDFTSDILRMKSAGVQFLFLMDEDVGSQARIINAAQQQGWHPQVITGSGIYDGNFLKLMDKGVNTDNIYIDLVYSLFLGEDRSTVKGVDNYLTWLEKTHPGAKPDLYGTYAFASTMLFAQALKDAGDNPTRESVLAAVQKIHKFDADGLVSPADVGAKKPPECWLLAGIKDGKYYRQLPPNTGFTCEPAGYTVVKASS